MALIDPEWSYWAAAFPAVFLNSAGADSLFTVSNIIIASVFPAEMQGLAGGVFNTVSQIGKSFGVAIACMISHVVTAESDYENKDDPEALMFGYRAAYWLLLAMNAASLFIGAWGLRKVGNVGRERK